MYLQDMESETALTMLQIEWNAYKSWGNFLKQTPLTVTNKHNLYHEYGRRFPGVNLMYHNLYMSLKDCNGQIRFAQSGGKYIWMKV